EPERSSMRVSAARTRWVTYAPAPSARMATPRGSRSTSTLQNVLPSERPTAVTLCVQAEVTIATCASAVTASPHASAGTFTRPTSTRPRAASGLNVIRRPGARAGELHLHGGPGRKRDALEGVVVLVRHVERILVRGADDRAARVRGAGA